MRKYFIAGYVMFMGLIAFAQKGGEVKLPLNGNFQLEQYAKQHQVGTVHSIKYSKTASSTYGFPFIERFTGLSALPDTSRWIDKAVSITHQSAVFNAQDATGTTYAGGGFGPADMLTSAPMILNVTTNLFVEFTYSTGATFSTGDSLVLQFQTSATSWQSLWHSPDIVAKNKTIILNVDVTNFNLLNVQFRFTNFTNILSGNTEDFLLHDVNFARKPDLPLYENFFTYGQDSFPDKNFWSQAKTVMTQGVTLGYPSLNFAVFDGFDENKNQYVNGTGFADTLTSQLTDISQFDPLDSVYLRFYYRAMPAAAASDSLILEFKNNVGVWNRIAGFRAQSSASGFKTFIKQINFGKYITGVFQYRLISKCACVSTDTLNWIVSGFNIGRKLLLPFVDDFSGTSVYPDQSLWKNRNVFINNQYPFHPPSFNVATFDGLDGRGNAYGYGNGYCDTLTSWPLNLSGISTGDTTVYLSFFVEPTGLGDAPNAGDSLILEMRNAGYDPGSYVTVWSGVRSMFTDSLFTQVFVRIDSSFLHDDLQIRFKNIGSKTGNIRHWHLDYVRIDKGRTKSDSTYYDLAISLTPTGVLKNYSSMPWDQFVVNKTPYQNDTIYFSIYNNDDKSDAVNWKRVIYDQLNVTLDSAGTALPGIAAGKDLLQYSGKHSTLTPANVTNKDTISFRTKLTLFGTSSDNIASNDTMSVTTVFSNYFAYDDGSAEAGYGIKNSAGSVALGYTLNKPDTFYGLSIFFNQSVNDVHGRYFDFVVWQDVAIPDPKSQLPTGQIELGRESHSGPEYVNQINGFYYYKFQNPIPVSGKFYIGWEQSTIFELNVGFDMNYMINGQYYTNPNQYFKPSDNPYWQQTQYSGALMIRPIVGQWIDPPLGVSSPLALKNEVSVFPNPAGDHITVVSDQTDIIMLELLDVTGKEIITVLNSENMEIPSLAGGIYLLRITDGKHRMAFKKLVVR